MMKHFMFDLESLGVESNAVVLSFACIPFDFDEVVENPTEFYEQLLNRALFVKFDAKEQFHLNRTTDKGTMQFWAEQEPDVRKMSFNPDASRDEPTKQGLKRLFDQVNAQMEGNPDALTLPQGYVFWQRGGLDQVLLDSLCKSVGMNPFINFWSWMDVRTMLTLTKDSTVRGYATVPGFDYRNLVVKHDPIHDCAYDVLMMLAGE